MGPIMTNDTPSRVASENGDDKTEPLPYEEVKFTFDPLEQLKFNIYINSETLIKETPKK